MVGLTTEQKKVIKRIKDKILTLIPVTDSKSVCWSHFYKVKDPNTDEFLGYIYALDCQTIYSFKSGGTSTANKHVNHKMCTHLKKDDELQTTIDSVPLKVVPVLKLSVRIGVTQKLRFARCRTEPNRTNRKKNEPLTPLVG